MVGQCCVQLSNGRTVLCPTVQCSDSAVSKCSLVRQCCIQLSNGWTMLCPTVQWSDSAVSNCPMVGLCWVQLSNGQTVLYPTVQWSDSAVSNLKFYIYSLKLSRNVVKLRTFRRTVWVWKSYNIGQFQNFCTPASRFGHSDPLCLCLVYGLVCWYAWYGAVSCCTIW